jgi:hypothetical protein
MGIRATHILTGRCTLGTAGDNNHPMSNHVTNQAITSDGTVVQCRQHCTCQALARNRIRVVNYSLQCQGHTRLQCGLQQCSALDPA